MLRDKPVRLLGYANEVGEAFKGLVSRRLYLGSYGVACAYAVADAADKAYRGGGAAAGVDALVWQLLASVAVPGATIAGVVELTRRVSPPPAARWAPTAAGLCAIPFIVQPIDRAVDFGMDATVRKLLAAERS